MVALVPGATAEQATSGPRSYQAGMLDVGDVHACAIRADGGVSCWGADPVLDGLLGDGELGNPVVNATAVNAVLPAGRTATAISVDQLHSCAVLDDGKVACWGRDDSGQLGDGAEPTDPDPTPAFTTPLPARAVSITAGAYHSCALLAGGNVYCWGDDTYGQLGDGTPGPALVENPQAVALPGGQGATAVAAGYYHTCAILTDGTVACWGRSPFGTGTELGRGGPALLAAAAVPALTLPLGHKAIAITAGANHTCAALEGGTVRCWGADGNGQLGDGTAGGSTGTPQAGILPLGQAATGITAGNLHTCATVQNGDIACWGIDSGGQLGDGTVSAPANDPVPNRVELPPGRTALTVSAGFVFTCATLDDASVLCWGDDNSGRLGDPASVGEIHALPSDVTPARAPGTMALVADLSLEILGAPATITQGGTAQITVKVKNAGPDPASGVAVALTATGITASATTLQMGTIAPSAEVIQLVTLTAPAAGAATFTAEVSASGAKDLDSTPNNAAAAEDDRAQVAIAVSSPAATPTPPATPTALTLSKFSLSSKMFRSKGLKGTRKVGTQIRFTLSVDAKVTVTIERKVAKKFKKAGSFSFTAKAGQVRRTFTGVIGKKPLTKGSYRMRIKATAGASSATLGPLAFRIATG